MTSGHDVREYLGTLGLVKSYFFKFFEKKKMEKNPNQGPTVRNSLDPHTPDLPSSYKIVQESCFFVTLFGLL